MPIWLILAGCSGETPEATPPPAGPAPTPLTLQFTAVPVSEDLAMATEPKVAPLATVNGVDMPLSYRVLHRSGVGGFGNQFKRSQKKGIFEVIEVCHDQDFISMLPFGTGAALLTHFECLPGQVYLSRLAPEGAGHFGVQGMPLPVSFDDWGGLWLPCAGQVSPWGTHVGSEEYEPDAAVHQPDGLLQKDAFAAWVEMVRYFPDPKEANPYHYGWATEITAADPTKNPVARKHYAMGRFSHELSYVLPDERTVLQSDDGSSVGLFLFVADQARDLTAGALYAAKFETTGPDEASVSWVPLGQTTHDVVATAIDAGVRFSDMFLKADVGEGSVCPDGFRFVDHQYGQECLKLAEPTDKLADPGLIASRLETRRYAAYLGATLEVEKGEGITYDPETKTAYFSISAVGKRALAEPGAPSDGLRFAENPCGAVAALPVTAGVVDTAGVAITSELVPNKLTLALTGRPLAAPDAEGNICDVTGIANPDNLAFAPEYGMLFVAEDTRRHTHARLWAKQMRQDGDLTPIVLAPRGGEITGIHWISDLHGNAYLTLAVQHPWALPKDVPVPPGITDEDKRSFTGYLGPFPK